MKSRTNEIKVPKKLLEKKPIHLSPYLNPGFIRMLVCGTSEGGKTYWTLNKLLPNLSPIANLFFVCGSGFQDGVYQNCIKYFRDRGTKVFLYESMNDIEQILKNKTLKNCNHNVVVLDDWTKEDLRNKLLIKLYSHERHQRCPIITISFRFYDFPQQIRSVINYITIFKTIQPNYIYQNSLKGIFPNLKSFLEIYEDATKQIGEDRGCIMIALDADLPHEALRIKRGIDGMIESYFQNL